MTGDEQEHLDALSADLLAAMEALKEAEAMCARARKKAEDLCKRLRSMVDDPGDLPGVTSGRGRRENMNGLHPGNLIGRPIPSSDDDQFGAFLDCCELFTPKQWEVICLHYRDRLTLAQIARQLGKSPNSISERLSNAKRLKRDYKKEVRAEKYAVGRSKQ